MSKSRPALTLVETLVALAIVGSLMAAVSMIVETVVRNRWVEGQETTTENYAEQVLDLLVSDVRGALSWTNPKSSATGEAEYDFSDGILLGVLTTNYLQQLDAQAHWRGLAKVYYQLEAGNSGAEQRLIRTEVLPAGKDTTQSVHRECLLDGLLSCKFSARVKDIWQNLADWQKDYPNELPSSLKITFTIKDPQTDQVKTFERLVIRSMDYQLPLPQKE